ncbi:Hint domain-containing protein [Aliiroseovarius crassostreae]|uniref:Hemolysin-type calcium-binding protein n=1 Tax=Aliiroseovarius crassostreae TaxID=154981 RepID=A0A0P7JQ95_9RHOB|nr:Hint domain-containing protein [Aliiroseovarius crassostreae]KPN63529.1 hemolysin-type calcium-binding protein [Aliiroseovarius crassostreae]SFU95724.1 Hint domain-containing protein [Aliiroseovarius crassostreae]
MKTGYRGTFVISWAQTEIDGLANAAKSVLGMGAIWRWTGAPLRVDGPQDVLRLTEASGEADLRRRAAKMVHKLVGAALVPGLSIEAAPVEDPLLNMGFKVTDGHRSFTITLIEVGPGKTPLLMFVDDVPPADTDLWVVEARLEPSTVNRLTDQPTGVICFTPGTRIRTPEGEVLVEDLREGDQIQTRDNGAQTLLWIGQRRISGARLFAMPELRPIRVRAGALSSGQPDEDLLVSPQHQLLLRGDRARDLFNSDEVLVRAQDLVDERRVIVDGSVREVTYYHLLLERHQVVWANGVAAESFHPAGTALETVEDAQRARLFEMFPALGLNPMSYGDYARRTLTKAEAAILRGVA